MKELSKVFKIVKEESPILYWVIFIHLIIAIGAILGFLFDDRTLMGINVWIKPLKFTMSTGIYILTVGFLITLYPYSKLKKKIINNVISWTLLVEIGIIFFQAFRGVQSHYNNDTLFDSILFLSMGVLIGINVLIMILFIVDTLRLKLNVTRSIQWSLCIGWILVFFGSCIGGQMIGQMSHSVGVADGGAGLPLVNWSTVGGDLRIAHFFGLHSLQIIPLFAWWVSKKWKVSESKQILIVSIFGILYASWIGFTFYQAWQGMPFIQL